MPPPQTWPTTVVLSALSTRYVKVPVSATKDGAAVNPTLDVVQFAFKPEGTNPTPADLVAGSWEANTSNPYVARCLVGPSGTIILAAGTYVIWVKVTDNPEIPYDPVGRLNVF